jgi:hypothetical protein
LRCVGEVCCIHLYVEEFEGGEALL